MGALSGDLGSRAESCGGHRKETPGPSAQLGGPAPSSPKNRRQIVPLPRLSPPGLSERKRECVQRWGSTQHQENSRLHAASAQLIL